MGAYTCCFGRWDSRSLEGGRLFEELRFCTVIWFLLLEHFLEEGGGGGGGERRALVKCHQNKTVF